MKTLLTLATLALAGATMIGCQSSSKTMASHPISGDVLEQMRAEFAITDAGVKLGSVDDVLPKEMLVKVGQVSAADFPMRTAVAIIDSNKQVVANGTVVEVFDTAVHVKYEAKNAARPPMVGDVAVKFTEKF